MKKTWMNRLVGDVRSRPNFYLAIALGLIGWAIVLYADPSTKTLLPKYAEF